MVSTESLSPRPGNKLRLGMASWLHFDADDARPGRITGFKNEIRNLLLLFIATSFARLTFPEFLHFYTIFIFYRKIEKLINQMIKESTQSQRNNKKQRWMYNFKWNFVGRAIQQRRLLSFKNHFSRKSRVWKLSDIFYVQVREMASAWNGKITTLSVYQFYIYRINL